MASALSRHGVGKDDTVAVMAANIPALYEAHFGVPMVGAVLNAINTRLDAATIAFILDHGEAKVLLTDREFAPVIAQALPQCSSKPLVIDIDDEAVQEGAFLGEMEYEAFLRCLEKSLLLGGCLAALASGGGLRAVAFVFLGCQLFIFVVSACAVHRRFCATPEIYSSCFSVSRSTSGERSFSY